MALYQVLVVDDSAFMRKIISDLIEKDSSFEVIATAATGREAIEKVQQLKPDIVTMDVEMPEMNGLEALKAIMSISALPVIMLSGINEQGIKETIMALELGAFDFIRKPSVRIDNDIEQVGRTLLEQMNAAMQAKERKQARLAEEERRKKELTDTSRRLQKLNAESPKTSGADKKLPNTGLITKETQHKDKRRIEPVKRSHPAHPDKLVKKQAQALPDRRSTPAVQSSKTTQPANAQLPPASTIKSVPSALSHLIAVGCSTGGPRALKVLLEQLPADLQAPVVIVQHMPPNFTKSLAQRLNHFSPLEVTEAEHGMSLKKGHAYLAPGGYHMAVVQSADGSYRIALSQTEPVNGHRPSVDHLYESLLPLRSLQKHLVLMTGMGSDGAKMMKRLYDAGVTSTFAESEETCVVYGMPRCAVELKCVTHTLPLQEIAAKLVDSIK